MRRPWLTPFIVLALVAPGVAGFAFGGPPFGLTIGALSVAALIVIAARTRFDEPIEIAGERRGHAILVLALGAIERPEQAQEIAEMAHAGALVESLRTDADPEVLVLAPATNRALAEWLSDLGDARFDAQRRLALSIGTLAAAGLKAHGQVGDADPVQAVEDALRSYRAREVVVVAGPEALEGALEELARRLPLPVRRLA